MTKLLTQREFTPEDFTGAKELAKAMGYDQHAYTSTSDLIGLHCLVTGEQYKAGKRDGTIIATAEFDLVFVQLAESFEA